MRIERHVWEGRAQTPRIEIVFGLTSLTPDQANPDRLLALVRQHWGAIENGHHHRRDRTYREDNSPVRDPNATACYAALRALAIFWCGQRKRAQRRPECYHLPDFHRWARARLATVLRWLTHTYTPP